MQFNGFYINLDTSVERDIKMQQQFAAYSIGGNYKRFEAIRGGEVPQRLETTLPVGHLGCWLSHEAVWLQGQKTDQHLHILEDDAVLSPLLVKFLGELILDDDSWDLLFTDVYFHPPPSPVEFAQLRQWRQDFSKSNKVTLLDLKKSPFTGTTSYIVNRRSIDKLLRLTNGQWKLNRTFDVHLQDLVSQGRIKAHVTIPFLSSVSPQNVESTTGGQGPAIAALNAFREALYYKSNPDVVYAGLCRGDCMVQTEPQIGPSDLTAQIEAKFRQALALHQGGQYSQAQALYTDLLKTHPDHSADALHLLGMIALQTKKPQKAVELFDSAIAINSNNGAFYSNRGVALKELKQYDAAVASCDKAIAIKPDFAEAYFNRGAALQGLKQLDAAIASYEQAIAVRPDYAVAHFNRGAALQGLRQLDAAAASYDKAIAIKPDYAEAYSNRGAALQGLKQLDAALASYDKAIAIKPDYVEAYSNRGAALQELRLFDAAVASYDKAIAINPDYAQAYSNRGTVLKDLKQYDAAVASYDEAIAIKPDHAEAYYNRGIALQHLKQLDAAAASYDKAMAIKPDNDFVFGMLLHARMHLCDWKDAEVRTSELFARIERGENVIPPLPVLALTASLSIQRQAAHVWALRYPGNSLENIPKRMKSKKIRVGYFSMDFRNHPVSYLMAELIETHSRSTFEVYAFSLGPPSKDVMRLRMEEAFENFIEIQNKSDEEIVKLSREIGIDIAIDLGGFTQDSRPGIFARRSAPIQVNFIGYPGTMGATFIDYIIADRHVLPEQTKDLYSEKVVYLPCFQPNDSKRKISEKTYTRRELGLPDKGFVFCCFNNSYKITQRTFDGWIRILKQVKDSILFLYADNETAAINLRNEAGQRGLDADRLVFGQRLSAPDYLARYRSADLFLDTYPFNGGTTASDSLWAGLPVLTCAGEAFASRMAASLLMAIDLPELIAATQEGYEALAIDLATNPERLRAIKDKLETNRQTTPLFDSKLYTRHIEDAYTQMYERYRADMPPDHLHAE